MPLKNLTFVKTATTMWGGSDRDRMEHRSGVTLTEDIDLVERLQSLLLDADLNASNYGDIFITPSL